MEKMASDGPKWGREDFFPTNPDLADILGRTDLNFERCLFFFFDPNFLDFQVPRSPNSQICSFPDLQISKFPDFQVPRFPDAAAGRILRSQPDPLPTHPGIKYIARAFAAKK